MVSTESDSASLFLSIYSLNYSLISLLLLLLLLHRLADETTSFFSLPHFFVLSTPLSFFFAFLLFVHHSSLYLFIPFTCCPLSSVHSLRLLTDSSIGAHPARPLPSLFFIFFFTLHSLFLSVYHSRRTRNPVTLLTL